MGLIVPFYVPVAWAVAGAALLALGLRKKPGFSVSIPWREGLAAGAAVLISAPVVAYSAWVFTTDRVYATWAAQNLILSPHPFHYLAAYGIPLLLAAFAVRAAGAMRGRPGCRWPGWRLCRCWSTCRSTCNGGWRQERRYRSTCWQRGERHDYGDQGDAGWSRRCSATMLPTSLVILTGSSGWMFARPAPVFRAAAEITALDWLAGQTQPNDVILTAYDTGTYLPVRVGARVFLGHGLETVDADDKEAMVTRFFGAATDDSWKQWLLAEYGVDYVFWGPAERALGDFDPGQAPYLKQVYDAGEYSLFEVKQ